MIRVKATREGLVGRATASTYVIDKVVPFVALPSTKALHKFVRLHNPLNGKKCIAIVLDVGPWNIQDNDYVFKGERPQAETGIDLFGRKTNKAGIDLSEKVWKLLGMKGNTQIEWEFIEV
jgi:hypothetical protein